MTLTRKDVLHVMGFLRHAGQDFRKESRPEGRNFGPGSFLVIHGIKY